MDETQEVVFLCNICNEVFCTQEETTVHMESHTFTSEFNKLNSVSMAVVEKHVQLPENSPMQFPGSTSKTDTKLWNNRNILLLIELTKKYDDDFQTSVKKYVWHKIADQISEETESTVTAQQCDTKWNSLLAMYKQIKKHNDTSGNTHKYWEFYDTMHESLHKKPEINPVATCSTRKGLNIGAGAVQDLDDIPQTSSASEQDSSSVSSNSKPFESSFMKKRKQQSSPAEKRHREKMLRQDRYLDILDRLTNAVEQKIGDRHEPENL